MSHDGKCKALPSLLGHFIRKMENINKMRLFKEQRTAQFL